VGRPAVFPLVVVCFHPGNLVLWWVGPLADGAGACGVGASFIRKKYIIPLTGLDKSII